MGSPILLNADVPEDPEVLNVIEQYRLNFVALKNDILGRSTVIIWNNFYLIRFVKIFLILGISKWNMSIW